MVVRRIRRGRARARCDESDDDDFLYTLPVTVADEEVNNDDMVVSDIPTSREDPIVIMPMSNRLVPDERAVQWKRASDEVKLAAVQCGSSSVALDRLNRYLNNSGLSLETYREQFGYSSVPEMLRVMQDAVSVAETANGELVVSAQGIAPDVDLIRWDDDAAAQSSNQNAPSTSGFSTVNSSYRNPRLPPFEYGEDADSKKTLLRLAASVFDGCKQSPDKQLRLSVYDEDLSAILPPPEAHACSPKELLQILTKFFRITFKIERDEEGVFVIQLLPDLLNDTEPTHPPTELTAPIDVPTPGSELPNVAIDFTKDHEVELGHIADDATIIKDRCTFALHLRVNRQRREDLEKELRQYTEAERRDPDPPVAKLIEGHYYLRRDPKASLARCRVTRIIDHAQRHNQIFAQVVYVDQLKIDTVNSSELIELPRVFSEYPPFAIVGFMKIRPDLKASFRSELVGARESKDVSLRAMFKRPEGPDANEYEVELTCLLEEQVEYVMPRDFVATAMPPPEKPEPEEPDPPPTYRVPSVGGVIRMPSAVGNPSSARSATTQPVTTSSAHDRSGAQRVNDLSTARLQPQPRSSRAVPAQPVRPAFQSHPSTNRPVPPIQTAGRPQPTSLQGRAQPSGVPSGQRPPMRGILRSSVPPSDRAGTSGQSRQMPVNHSSATRGPPVTRTHAAASTTLDATRSGHSYPSGSRQPERDTLPDIAFPEDEGFIKDHKLGAGPVKKLCTLCGAICLDMTQAREHLHSKSHRDAYLEKFKAEIGAKLIGQEYVHTFDSPTLPYACMLCGARLRNAEDVKEHLASERHTRDYSARICDPRNWDPEMLRNWLREVGTSLLGNLGEAGLTGADFVAFTANDFERELRMSPVDAIRAYTLVRKVQTYYAQE